MPFGSRAQLKIIGKRRAKIAERTADGLFAQLRPAKQGEIPTHRRLRLWMCQPINFRQRSAHDASALDSKKPRESDADVEPKGPVKCLRVVRFQVSV